MNRSPQKNRLTRIFPPGLFTNLKKITFAGIQKLEKIIQKKKKSILKPYKYHY